MLKFVSKFQGFTEGIGTFKFSILIKIPITFSLGFTHGTWWDKNFQSKISCMMIRNHPNWLPNAKPHSPPRKHAKVFWRSSCFATFASSYNVVCQLLFLAFFLLRKAIQIDVEVLHSDGIKYHYILITKSNLCTFSFNLSRAPRRDYLKFIDFSYLWGRAELSICLRLDQNALRAVFCELCDSFATEAILIYGRSSRCERERLRRETR